MGEIGKMSGMSPPRTHVLGTEPHGRNHETWLENRMSIVWETDIFVVISSVDGRDNSGPPPEQFSTRSGEGKRSESKYRLAKVDAPGCVNSAGKLGQM